MSARGGGAGTACIVWAIAAAAFATLALRHGRDANWDRQNYHLYDAVAFLTGRAARDVMPAGPQSTLNPVPYLVPYWLERHLGPRAGTAVLASLQAAVVPFAWRVAAAIPAGTVIRTLAVLAAATAAMVLAEIGTSFEELLLAVPAIAALARLLARPDRPLAAGVLAGLPIGFKIALLPEAAAFLAAVLAIAPPDRRRVRAAMHAVAGLAAGGLASGGAWALVLLARFGNPFFPFLNRLFRAPDAAPIAFQDDHAIFHGPIDALLRPFRAAFLGIPVPFDVPFRDARPAAGLVVALLLLATRPRMPPPMRRLVAYLLAGEAVWLVAAPIERYALAFDVVAGLLAILGLAELLAPRARVPACLAATVALVATTAPSEFFHRPWSPAWTARPPAIVGPGYDLVLLGIPLGAWAVADPPPAHAYMLDPNLLPPGGRFARRLADGLARDGDRLWSVALDVGLSDAIRAGMTAHGLVRRPPCARAAGMYFPDVVFCRLSHGPPVPRAAATLPLGRPVRFTRDGDGTLYEADGWSVAEGDGTRVDGPTGELVAAAGQGGPLELALDLAGGGRRVCVAPANGVYALSLPHGAFLARLTATPAPGPCAPP